MILHAAIYLVFVIVSLIVPGYAFVRKTGLGKNAPGLQLCMSITLTLAVFAFLATFDYVFDFNAGLSRVLGWSYILLGVLLFIRERYYVTLRDLRFPLFCWLAASVFSLAFIGLNFNAPYKIIPDPQVLPDRNYSVLDVKILNVADTAANDNYIPYRQAQFFINRSNPARDSFINEWGVSFFQRTPLMGATVADYFNLLNEKPPVAYTWSSAASDPSHTFLQFQIIAQLLNALFIIPAIYVVLGLFNKRTAIATAFFLISSQFFVYNAFFSWPKSLVAFFVLTALLLLIRRNAYNTALAGAVSGIAYLTHDLALIYVGAFIIYLAATKRFRDIPLYLFPVVLLMLPWLWVAGHMYHKTSSFIYYPFSVNGIPKTDKGNLIMRQFFDTSLWQVMLIRLKSLWFLLSPYQLFSSGGGQDTGRRLWALGLYSVPGSLGFGLLVPGYISIIRYFKKLWRSTLLILLPILGFVVVTGWDISQVNIEGALHYAEVVVVIWSGLAVYWLSKAKRPYWLPAVYVLNTAQFIFFTLYSYKYRTSAWFDKPRDLVLLLTLASVLAFGFWVVYEVAARRKTWHFLGAEVIK